MEIELHFGIMADPLEKQLAKHSIKIKNIETYQRCSKAISMLYILGYMTETEQEKIYKRLIKDLQKEIEKES